MRHPEASEFFHFLKDPNFFAVGATADAAIPAEILSAEVLANAKSVGLFYCAEIAACVQAVPVNEAAAKALGMKYGPLISFLLFVGV